MRTIRNRLAAAVSTALLGTLVTPVLAQTSLEEIVVTAQRREQNLREVPISMTALSGEQLQTRGIEGIANINSIAPNVTFRESPGATLISIVSIRGSTAGQPAIWMDPPVGMYVDGVYVGKSQGSVFDVVDIERIEVLRGPQGTLFGRNTEGGAINFISRKPSGEFSGSVGMEYGRFDHMIERVSVDLPKYGWLSTSFGYRQEDRDEIIENDTPRVGDFGSRNREAWRFAAQLDPSDELRVNYLYDHSEADDTPRASTTLHTYGWQGQANFSYAGFAPYIETNRPWSVATNARRKIFERSDVDGHSLTVSYALNEHNEIKLIGAHREMSYADGNDLDGTPLTPQYQFSTPAGDFSGPANMYYQRHTDYDADSVEIQWVGDIDRLSYVLGYYYFEDDGDTWGPQDFFVGVYPDLYGVTYSRADYGAKTKANAWFAQFDYSLTDRLVATVGYRITEEDRSGYTHRYNTDGYNGPALQPGDPLYSDFSAYGYDATFSADTPVFALNYSVTDEVNVYVRYAEGFKSGGFASELTNALVYTPFEPENSTTYELGVKAALLDNRLSVSAAVFSNEISDLHITQLIPGTSSSQVKNAGEATYQGFELEGAWVITDGWIVQLNYGYLDSEFGDFIDYPIDYNPATGLYYTNSTADLIDTGSNRVPPYAPEHTLNIALDGLLAKTGVGDLRIIVDYTFTSSNYLYAANKSLDADNAGGQYLDNLIEIPDVPNLNARLLLAEIPVGGPGYAEFSIFGRNLTDFKDELPSIDFGTYINTNWPTPRTYGMALNYKW